MSKELNNLAINTAYQYISKWYSVKELNDYEKKKYRAAWRVNLEFLNGDSIEEINILLYFPFEFPYKIPKIYLDNAEYNRIKYIPHLDTDKNLCLFQTESLSLPIEKPEIIVYECLKRAKELLEKGLLNKNESAIFEEEFLAYWQNKYGEKDIVDYQGFLALSTELLSNEDGRLIALRKEFRGIKYALLGKDDISINFLNTLKYFQVDFEDVSYIIIGSLFQTKPPFCLSNGELVKSIQQKFSKKELSFKRAINNNEKTIVIFHKKIGQYHRYFGFQLSKQLILRKNGFRPGALTPFKAMTSFQKNESLKRYSGRILTPSRIITRTGDEPTKEHRVCIAGLGSIGSNLIYFLSSINISEYNLIDYEILGIENIGRHYLGFSSIRNYKTTSIKNKLLNDKPYLKVNEKQKSVFNVIENETDFINKNDLFVVAIGDDNIEKFIADKIKDKTITVPTLFLWVEPYLCGGHMVYIHPDSPLDFEQMYDKRIYKFNVIDASEYESQNDKLILKEAGCQSTFTPYSQLDINSFLNSISREILSILDGENFKSNIYTWIGDKRRVNDLSIKISEKYSDVVYGQLIKQYEN